MTGDNTLRGKNVLVVGAGSSGMAAISALRKEEPKGLKSALHRENSGRRVR